MAANGKPWAEMTAEERLQYRCDSWLEPAGVEFASPEAKAAYRGRVTRLVDAVRLEKTPDRVPVLCKMDFYPAVRLGYTQHDAMYDIEKAKEAWYQVNIDLQLDGAVGPLHNTMPGKAYEILEYKLYNWPGHGVPETAGYQYNEDEYMLPEEYDHLIADPSDFLWRVYLPRIVGAYEGFSVLAPAYDMVELPFTTAHIGPWSAPNLAVSFEKLAAAGREVAAWAEQIFPLINRINAQGFPDYWSYASKAPFDFIGDSLRGTRAIITDMFRDPDRLKAACDRLVPVMVNWVLAHTTHESPPGIFIPLHKGADGFMSDAQFHEFYWPSLRAVMLGLMEHGFVPWLFAEGGYNQRLEAIMDLPKGRSVWMFDQTDMARAKETVGKVACIQGNVPLSLMHIGTADAVTEHCKKLIDTAGPGGGYILDVGAVLASAKDENVKAMIAAAKEYGVY